MMTAFLSFLFLILQSKKILSYFLEDRIEFVLELFMIHIILQLNQF